MMRLEYREVNTFFVGWYFVQHDTPQIGPFDTEEEAKNWWEFMP